MNNSMSELWSRLSVGTTILFRYCPPFSFLLAGGMAVLFCIVYLSGSPKVAPGPKRRFLLGNLLDLPREREWLQFTEWSKQYGDIVYLDFLGRSMIILNTMETCVELLQKRWKIYSDRPSVVMAGELMGWNDEILLQQYGPRLRQMRKFVNDAVSLNQASIQERETVKYLKRVLESPDRHVEHTRHRNSSIILMLSHGYTVSERNDPLIILAEKVAEELGKAFTPGAFLVDIIPWLKYLPESFPGAGFQRKAKKYRQNLYDLHDMGHNFTKSQMLTNSVAPSLTSMHLTPAMSPEDEEMLKRTAGTLHVAGVESSSFTFETFILAMCLYPEVQRTAQAELDRIIGNERLPGIGDRASLPYIEAIMKETLRWIPVAPIGSPHAVRKDDEYKGYSIPGGTTVIPNVWAMSRDKRYFPDPETFRPERYLDDEIKDNDFADPLHFIFGFGARACPGQKIAEPSIFLAIAMVLSVFIVKDAHDLHTGKAIHPDNPETSFGVLIRPKRFNCSIIPRSEEAIKLIRHAHEILCE